MSYNVIVIDITSLPSRLLQEVNSRVTILHLSVQLNYNALGFPSVLVSLLLQRSAGLITLMMISEGQTEYVDQPGRRTLLQICQPVFTLLHCSTISSHGTLDAHARTLALGHPGHRGHHGQTWQSTFQLRGWGLEVRGSLTFTVTKILYPITLPHYLVLHIEGKNYVCQCLGIFPLWSCTLWSMIWLPWSVGHQCCSENTKQPSDDILKILKIICLLDIECSLYTYMK